MHEVSKKAFSGHLSNEKHLAFYDLFCPLKCVREGYQGFAQDLALLGFSALLCNLWRPVPVQESLHHDSLSLRGKA